MLKFNDNKFILLNEELKSFSHHQHIMTSLTLKTRVANPDLLTVNRYRLSASAEYFVPNKTLYADYVAFIKELPGVEDHR